LEVTGTTSWLSINRFSCKRTNRPKSQTTTQVVTENSRQHRKQAKLEARQTSLQFRSRIRNNSFTHYYPSNFSVGILRARCTVCHKRRHPPYTGGVYGTALATMGMLAVMGMVLALDGFGPIADNAAGIAEMAGEKTGIEHGSFRCSRNTTKALTKVSLWDPRYLLLNYCSRHMQKRCMLSLV